MSTACRPALAARENRGAARSQQHVLSKCLAGCSDPAQASQLPGKVALFEHIIAAYPHSDKHTENCHNFMTQERAKSGQSNRETRGVEAKEKIQQN